MARKRARQNASAGQYSKSSDRPSSERVADLGNVCLEIRKRVVILLHTDEHTWIDLAALQVTLEPHSQRVVAMDDHAQLQPDRLASEVREAVVGADVGRRRVG